MGWMLRLCPRFRARWRMSSDVLGGRGRVVAPPLLLCGFAVLECDVLWRRG